MAKKHKHEEHENHERWLVSYADFITLLFAFFVVMYSVSRVDVKKVDQASKSISWAMKFEGTGGVGQLPIFDGPASDSGCASGGSSSSGAKLGQKEQAKTIDNVRKRIDRALKPVLIEPSQIKSVVVTLENGRLSIRLAAATFFDSGGAALRPESLPVIDAITSELAILNRPIRIEGHTDDTSIDSTRFRNNWELSAARAAAVVSYMELAHHIAPANLTASGMGAARPLVPNDSTERREMNRRVEIAVEMFTDDRLTPLTR